MPLPLFTVARLGVRAVVLVALVAWIANAASELSPDATWDGVTGAAESVLNWLAGLFGRVADLDLRMVDVELSDLATAGDWLDAVRGVFGGSEGLPPTTPDVAAPPAG